LPLLGLVTSASAHQEVVGNLKIGHPWVREAPTGASGTYACIIEIKNDGDEPETLLGATIDGGGTGVIYQIIEKDGKFSSKPVEHGLVIKPHGSIELTPTTYQIRFGKITKDLTEDTMSMERLCSKSCTAPRSTLWSNKMTLSPRKNQLRRQSPNDQRC
jgi:copper(I)-binding protein